MATTVNGYIAGQNDDTDWVKDLEAMKKTVEDFGIIVMGRRTYNECMKYNVFPYKGAFNIVMTHAEGLLKKHEDNVLFTDLPPKNIIELVGKKGFDKLLVIGGGHINGSFLAADLINEIILDIHPLIMAKGINLFEGDFPYKNLELISYKQINDQLLRVRYSIKK